MDARCAAELGDEISSRRRFIPLVRRGLHPRHLMPSEGLVVTALPPLPERWQEPPGGTPSGFPLCHPGPWAGPDSVSIRDPAAPNVRGGSSVVAVTSLLLPLPTGNEHVCIKRGRLIQPRAIPAMAGRENQHYPPKYHWGAPLRNTGADFPTPSLCVFFSPPSAAEQRKEIGWCLCLGCFSGMKNIRRQDQLKKLRQWTRVALRS